MHARTKENVAMADELVISEEDETQIHHLTHPVGQFGSFFFIAILVMLGLSKEILRMSPSSVF